MPEPTDRATAILQKNLQRVHALIRAAAGRAGRSPAEVGLVAVTKYASDGIVRALLASGQYDLGESRAQQLATRAEASRAPLPFPATDGAGPPSPRWHMIGHLQTNKARYVVPVAVMIHSLDSVRLADQVQKVAERLDQISDVLLEVNVAGESCKSGAAIAEVAALADHTCRCPRLRVRGLMAMAPQNADPEAARPHFARLRELSLQLREHGQLPPEARALSMGMSQDFTVAVEEGATLVRVGSMLFENLLFDAAAGQYQLVPGVRT